MKTPVLTLPPPTLTDTEDLVAYLRGDFCDALATCADLVGDELPTAAFLRGALTDLQSVVLTIARFLGSGEPIAFDDVTFDGADAIATAITGLAAIGDPARATQFLSRALEHARAQRKTRKEAA
jgi:hypothetical protein